MNYFGKQRRMSRKFINSLFYGKEDAGVLRECLDAGVEANAAYAWRGTKFSLLYWAVYAQRQDAVDLLLSRGADPNGPGGNNETPLTRAVGNNSLDIVKSLIAAGADVNAADSYGNIPVISAVRNGYGEVVQVLADSGADLDVRTRDGSTPLHLAAAQGYANIVRMLIDKGADATATNGNLNTAADVAEKEYPGLAQLIRGEKPQEPAAPRPETGWRILAPDEIAHVAVREAIGYRITEIFNFRARTYTQIAANLESRAESQFVKAFSELDDGPAVAAAHRELLKLGGKAEFAGEEKKKLPVPQAGG